MKKNLQNIKRILILQTAFIGDVILTLPLLQKTRQIFPEAQIDFLTIPASSNLVETHPAIDHLLLYDKHRSERGWLSMRRWQKQLKQADYQLALVPHRSLRSAWLVKGAKIPLRIGFDKSAGRFLFSKVITYPQNIHEINRNLHLLSLFGVDPSEKIFPDLYFTEADHEQVNRWIEKAGFRKDLTTVTLAPGSVWATKRWLPERFGELATRLRHAGFQVVLLGGAADFPVIEEVLQVAGNGILNSAGQFSLRQSALLIRHAGLLVTNDSAPLHMATAVHTPVIAIFGPTVPAFGFHPYGENDVVIEEKDLSCRPCSIHGGQKCPIGTFVCMRNISVERVFKQVEQVFNETAKNQSGKSRTGIH